MGYDQNPPVRPDSAGAQIQSNRGHAGAQHPPTAFAAAGSQASAVLDVQTAAAMLLQYPPYLHAQFIAAWMQ